ncbi:D-alanyl-D-alanine carboxypeptidase/D-alanyl-D-alanine-endopeptidase [Chryseobacterium sp. MFBS3-17]|uniref:D-alanyl-D-alanine carboxypeptidase/D-alanyl-D-alanine endopeptidase n=1 Tax=Chryseobacterium sp. MFBS3-17 TaxID=2886689 RepID=UPI001D0E448F|nr:D-alanyl-D-alanine carboxypeptidase/D-alanyl-D-alanine-endopeptidase [Chryseobacterium sp. MFBS3-17]MCC2591607.1 D-alanyl-D-alanine carboxypeptidase/D-alanyl-D-alanine-endopeptidase [Chryseobacterium sp. MFBS3-17]
MKKLMVLGTLCSQLFFAQNISSKLEGAVKKLMDSDPATAASLSFYVADDSGNLVYEYQGNKGLTSASTQKIFTAAAALETLGRDYTYKTTASHSGTVAKGVLAGNLFISSNGDPTLGSWRYDGWKPENFKQKLIKAIKEKGISKINGDLIIDDVYFDFQTVPGGWPWDDMGNYYGAGVWSVNWRENQFDMNLKNGIIQDFNVDMKSVRWVNDVKVGGSSDQSLIFTAPHSTVGVINGTLPAKPITVSGAMPNPPLQLGHEIKKWLAENRIDFNGKIVTNSMRKIEGRELLRAPAAHVFFTYESPTLEKIVYWFLRRSINLYGETLLKTMAMEKTGTGSFDAGLVYLKSFWKSKGINEKMINFADGSGLSPQNYVSAKAEVQSLLWTMKQPWFSAFYNGLPEQNGMRMKSGTVKDTKSFGGYHSATSGKKYVYAIIINNYQGNNVSDALYQVLNHLK